MKRSNVMVLFTCSNCTADVSGSFDDLVDVSVRGGCDCCGYSSAVEVRCPKCNYSEELRSLELESKDSPAASGSVPDDQGGGVRS
jgi:hypothetical protein